MNQQSQPLHSPAEFGIRRELAAALEGWLVASHLTQAAAAARLGTTQARISEIKHGKVDHFSMDLLVRLAVRAGLEPRLVLTTPGNAAP